MSHQRLVISEAIAALVDGEGKVVFPRRVKLSHAARTCSQRAVKLRSQCPDNTRSILLSLGLNGVHNRAQNGLFW